VKFPVTKAMEMEEEEIIDNLLNYPRNEDMADDFAMKALLDKDLSFKEFIDMPIEEMMKRYK